MQFPEKSNFPFHYSFKFIQSHKLLIAILKSILNTDYSFSSLSYHHMISQVGDNEY